MPVDSESPTWISVEETKENTYLPETPLSPAEAAATQLFEGTADRSMFNLIIRKMIAQ